MGGRRALLIAAMSVMGIASVVGCDQESTCAPTVPVIHNATSIPLDTSPSDGRLLFAWARSGSPDSSGLYLRSDTDGGRPDLVRILPVEVLQYCNATFAPDGRKICFWDARDREVYQQTLLSGETVQLTGSGGSEIDPAYDPDGRYLVYVDLGTNEDAVPPGPGLRLLDLQTREETILVSNGMAVSGANPRWSPSGDKIVFSVYAPDDLVYFQFSTGQIVRVTETLDIEFFIGWQNEGDSFYYVALDAKCGFQQVTYLWDSETNTREKVAEDFGPVPRLAVVSRDGEYIYYVDVDDLGTSTVIKRQKLASR